MNQIPSSTYSANANVLFQLAALLATPQLTHNFRKFAKIHHSAQPAQLRSTTESSNFSSCQEAQF